MELNPHQTIALSTVLMFWDHRQNLTECSVQIAKRELEDVDAKSELSPRAHAVIVTRQEQEPDTILEFSRKYGADDYVLFGSSNFERDVKTGELKLSALKDRIGRPKNVIYTSTEPRVTVEFDQVQVQSVFKTILYGIEYDDFMRPEMQETINKRVEMELGQCAGCETLKTLFLNWLDWERGVGRPGKFNKDSIDDE